MVSCVGDGCSYNNDMQWNMEIGRANKKIDFLMKLQYFLCEIQLTAHSFINYGS
jgi:aminopeptidase-like protein